MQSTDFVEKITDETMESFYKVKDLTILGVPKNGKGAETSYMEEQRRAYGL